VYVTEYILLFITHVSS